MPNLELRNNQVFSGLGAIPKEDYQVTDMTIQEHAADKAGTHYDIRLNLNGRAVSFAARKGLPNSSTSPRLLIRQPDHVVEYMDWEGNIPKGQYGAGSVSISDKQRVVVSPSEDVIRLHIPKGPNSGTYSIRKTDGEKWLAIKHKPLERSWYERPSYKAHILDLKETPEDQYLVSRKYDGAHFIAELNPGGIALTSQNKSVSGELIPREENFPHIRHVKVPPELVGTVLRGELYHKKGFNTLSSIALSSPDKAVQLQQEQGLAEFIPFDVIKYKGKYFTEYTPEERAKIVEDVANALPTPYITPPERKRKSESLREFYDRIVSDGGEGVILQDKASGEFYKKKHRIDYDLEISDVLEGTGRLKGSLGALVLRDRSGADVGKVGTGFSDALRQEIFSKKNKYIGRLVKVTSDRSPVPKSLRSPSFIGFTVDKSVPDLL